MLGATAGAKVEKNGYRAGAELGIGTGVSGKVELGKEIKLNTSQTIKLNTSQTLLDVSVYADHVTDLSGEKNKSQIVHRVGTEKVGEVSADWTNSITRTGAKAMLGKKFMTKNGSAFAFGAGVSGQYATNNGENITLTNSGKLDNGTYYIESSVQGKKEGFVVSPEFKVSYNSGKHWSIDASGNSFGGGVNVRYTF